MTNDPCVDILRVVHKTLPTEDLSTVLGLLALICADIDTLRLTHDITLGQIRGALELLGTGKQEDIGFAKSCLNGALASAERMRAI